MQQSSDLKAIADRVRRLIFGVNAKRFSSIARRLRVGELALRRTVDTSMPTPDPDVLAAIVKEFGVDPNWLLTGEYDANSHRSAMETTSRASLAGRFRRTLARRAIAPEQAENPQEL